MPQNKRIAVSLGGIGAFACLFAAGIVFSISSCTNLEVDPISTRYDDNFSGALSEAENIDPAGTNQFTFAVISDTHVGSPGGRIVGSVLDRIKSAGDAFVLMLGDITDTGRDEQYNELKDMLNSRNLVYRTALGNHDIFFGGWEHFKKHMGRSIYSFNADNVHVTVIDAANGVIGQRQLGWIEQDLRSSTAEHKVVISHFPPWNGTFSSIYKMASEEEAALLKNLLSETDVDVMFAGHYHGYNETEIGGVKYIVTGGANDLIDIGNSQHYFRVRVNGSEMTTEYVSY